MGVWALLVSLGPPLAPLIMGFVGQLPQPVVPSHILIDSAKIVYNKSWHWIFYLLAIIFLAEFVLYIFLGPETLYERPSRAVRADDETVVQQEEVAKISDRPSAKWYTPYISFKRHDRTPWSRLPMETLAPLKMITVMPVFLAATAYAVSFTYSK